MTKDTAVSPEYQEEWCERILSAMMDGEEAFTSAEQAAETMHVVEMALAALYLASTGQNVVMAHGVNDMMHSHVGDILNLASA